MTGPDTPNSEMFSCAAARRRSLSYQEGHLPPNEMELMRNHLAECPMCAEHSGAVYELRKSLRTLPPPAQPPNMNLQLRVTASKEAARRRSRRTAGETLKAFVTDWKLWTNNLMRPFAIPTAGGFVSAVMLFSIFASGITVPSGSGSTTADVPTGLYTEASVKSYLPFGFNGSDLFIEITIDDQGRVVDYSLPKDMHFRSPELRRNIENHLLFTKFTPATSFGQPLPGKVWIWFRSSRIDVKG